MSVRACGGFAALVRPADPFISTSYTSNNRLKYRRILEMGMGSHWVFAVIVHVVAKSVPAAAPLRLSVSSRRGFVPKSRPQSLGLSGLTSPLPSKNFENNCLHFSICACHPCAWDGWHLSYYITITTTTTTTTTATTTTTIPITLNSTTTVTIRTTIYYYCYCSYRARRSRLTPESAERSTQRPGRQWFRLLLFILHSYY